MMVFTSLYTEQGVKWTDDGVYVAYIVGKECGLEHPQWTNGNETW